MNYEEQLLSILNNCDKEKLNSYLNDNNEADIDDLINSLDYFKTINNEIENYKSENKLLAESNLSKEPLINRLKQQLLDSINDLEKAKNEYFNLATSYSITSGESDMSLEAVYTILQTRATKAEEETDRLAEDFFLDTSKQHNDDELNQFQRLFLEQRTQAHLKKIKADKMKELLEKYKS